MSAHTPTQTIALPLRISGMGYLIDANGNVVGGNGINGADAILLMRYANSHEALVKALENARMGLVFAAREGVKISEDSPLLSEITAALKLARGEA